jgi:hypothetical protein
MSWAALLKGLKKIPWQVWACAGLLFLFWYYGVVSEREGKAKVQRQWTASIERGKVIVEELKNRQAVITISADTQYIDRVKVIHEKGDTIVKQVKVYVPLDLPDLPGSVRLLHDAAATNSIPDPTGIFNAAPIGVRDFTGTVVTNYETCHVTALRLRSLQDWVTAQRQAYLESCKQKDVHCSKGK